MNSVTWESKSPVPAGAFDFAGHTKCIAASRQNDELPGSAQQRCKLLDPRRQQTGGKLDPREDEWMMEDVASLACLQERLWWKHERRNLWSAIVPHGHH